MGKFNEQVWGDSDERHHWLRSRADELGLDPGRIAAWGESAGGHLAELLGLTGQQLDGQVGIAGPGTHVKAVVAWYAPSDLAALATDTGVDPYDRTTREAQLLGAPPVSVPELAAQASPLSYVSSQAPPFLLLHGRADRFISHRQSERLHAALAANDADVSLHLYDDADHMWLGSPQVAPDALRRTIEFLQHHLLQDASTATGNR